jgi:hypothetical protein
MLEQSSFIDTNMDTAKELRYNFGPGDGVRDLLLRFVMVYLKAIRKDS